MKKILKGIKNWLKERKVRKKKEADKERIREERRKKGQPDPFQYPLY